MDHGQDHVGAFVIFILKNMIQKDNEESGQRQKQDHKSVGCSEIRNKTQTSGKQRTEAADYQTGSQRENAPPGKGVEVTVNFMKKVF